MLNAYRDKAKQAVTRRVRPLALRVAAMGVGPNAITLCGAALSALAAVVMVSGSLFLAGLVLLLAGAMDLFDGIVAREAGRMTRFGAFLDSSLDRLSDGAIFIAAIVLFARDSAEILAGVTALALLGSLMVSYVKARAEALAVTCKGGLLTRAERVGLLIAGLLTGWLAAAMIAIAILSWITVIQRLREAGRALKA